jgi:hypothetical protein
LSVQILHRQHAEYDGCEKSDCRFETSVHPTLAQAFGMRATTPTH